MAMDCSESTKLSRFPKLVCWHLHEDIRDGVSWLVRSTIYYCLHSYQNLGTHNYKSTRIISDREAVMV